MSAATPVIFDDGSKALVPAEQLSGALKDGGKVAQAMQFDDGSKAYVTLDRVHDAIHDGGMLIGTPPQPPRVNMQEMDTPSSVMSAFSNVRVPNLEAGTQAPVSTLGQEAKGAAEGGALDAGAVALGAAGPPVIKAVAKFAAKHPTAAAMAGSTAIGEARKIPYVGKLIPPGAEVIPWLLGKGEPESGAPIERDATAGNEAYAGEEEAAPTPPAAAPAEAKPTGAPIYRDATLNKRNIPEYAGEEIPDEHLPQASAAVVDQAIPPGGENHGTNLLTKAQVDFALKRGDVAGAESALDAGAKNNPNWPPERPNIVPATQNIRENDAMVTAAEAQSGPRRAELNDDQATQQEMNWNLEQHGYRAESEARREFIARNSTGVTKGQLVKAAQNPQPEDLTPSWQAALDAIKKAKSQQPPTQ